MLAGNLVVKIKSARDLKDTEWFSKQDPYCVLHCGSSQFRTKAHTDAGKQPTWNQQFECSISASELELKLAVWNANKLSADTLIGSGRLALSTVFQQGFHDACVQLTSNKGKAAGEVYVTVQFQPAGGAHAMPGQHPVHSVGVGASSGGEVTVTVGQASRLKDVEVYGQRQDPYCVLQVGTSRFKTRKVTDGGKNPSFGDTFRFTVAPTDLELKAEVWDANVVSSDRIIGSGRLSLAPAMQPGAPPRQLMIPLADPAGRSAGELNVTVSYSGTAGGYHGAPHGGAPPPHFNAPPPAAHPGASAPPYGAPMATAGYAVASSAPPYGAPPAAAGGYPGSSAPPYGAPPAAAGGYPGSSAPPYGAPPAAGGYPGGYPAAPAPASHQYPPPAAPGAGAWGAPPQQATEYNPYGAPPPGAAPTGPYGMPAPGQQQQYPGYPPNQYPQTGGGHPPAHF